MSNGVRLTLEQEEAKFALECIEKVKDNILEITSSERVQIKSYPSDYHRFAKRLPAMILNNGLGPTLAFIKASSEKENDSSKAAAAIYSHFTHWLCKSRQVYPEDKDLLKSIVSTEMYTYFEAQDLALRLATWLSRLADAYLPKE
ncbi:MAG: type III-B CRISPR module-associated protein Cmr5 [Candidatus Thorarchaeota archaeon]|nr:type III-B CRISPR module-associated protein Cmr5 [Candidatus Thorarchaeota archaeon]